MFLFRIAWQGKSLRMANFDFNFCVFLILCISLPVKKATISSNYQVIIMKRRTLKRIINNRCGELFACVLQACHNNDAKANEDRDKAIAQIIMMQDDLVARLSHVEIGSTRLFFKKLHADFHEAESKIADMIIKLL